MVPEEYFPRHATTNTVRPAQNSNAAPFNSELGRASNTLNQQFPNSPAASGFDVVAVERLRYALLDNEINNERLNAVGLFGQPGALLAKRAAQADSIEYWGFSDQQQVSLSYVGGSREVDGVLVSAPKLQDMGKTKSPDGQPYRLLSPFVPNLIPPKTPGDGGLLGPVQIHSVLEAHQGEFAVSQLIRPAAAALPGSHGSEGDVLDITFKLPDETSQYDGEPRALIRARKGKGSGTSARPQVPQ